MCPGGGTFQNKGIRPFLLPLAFELGCSLRKFPRTPEVQGSSLSAGSDILLSPDEEFAPRDNGVDRSVHLGLISAPQGPLSRMARSEAFPSPFCPSQALAPMDFCLPQNVDHVDRGTKLLTRLFRFV